MHISTGYGKSATPSENNSFMGDVTTALGGTFQVPTYCPTENVIQAVQAYQTYNGAAGGAVGGTFATFHALRLNQPL